MSFYPRLPDELKVDIWEKAITPEHGGVHHFKIGFYQPRKYQQTFIVHPCRDNVDDDPSSWVDLWRLSLASRISWDLVEKSNHADRVLFWQKAPPQNIKVAAYGSGLPASKGAVKTPQEELDAVDKVPSHKIPKPTQAFINGDKDIVYFTFVGSDFDLDWVHWENNRRRFCHVANVAFNCLRLVASPSRWISSPFECSCGRGCAEAGFCIYALCSFLCIFESLKNVYIAIPITASRIRQPAPEPLPRGTKRGRGGQAIKKTGSQLVTEAMDKFKGTVGLVPIFPSTRHANRLLNQPSLRRRAYLSSKTARRPTTRLTTAAYVYSRATYNTRTQ